ncbi:MAG: heavy metal-binding domain-containing protein [Armatimonadota bacterium]
MAIVTGLSGNEMFCLDRKGFAPGELVVGNAVHSLGFVGSLGAGLRTLAGGEVEGVTEIVHEGRLVAVDRLLAEARRHGAHGITGIDSEIIRHPSTIEFLSVGSGIHHAGERSREVAFSTAADGQELYCQLDAGFMPVRFVFGNVAYSIGFGGGIRGGLRALARGEVKEFSDIFNETRHLALDRITREARVAKAHAVVGVRTTIHSVGGAQEMVMVGTASRHAALEQAHLEDPITSDLTNEEMWNCIHLGYMPVRIVLGVSVTSLGFVGSFTSVFRSLVRGEIPELSSLVYEARESAISRIRADAELCGADDVLGVRTYVYQLGSGLIEFLAIGTAVRRMPGLTTLSPELPPQAVLRDKDTFVNAADASMATDLNDGSARRAR